MLILEYFFADCIPPILLKHLVTYNKNKTLKTSFGLGGQELHLGHNHNIFAVVSLAVFIFLNSHKITCRMCTFSSSIFVA